MWYDCYKEKGIREHYGLTGKEAVPVLRKLRDHMEENRERLKEMEPDNGWGSYIGALKFVGELIIASLENPDEVWYGPKIRNFCSYTDILKPELIE